MRTIEKRRKWLARVVGAPVLALALLLAACGTGGDDTTEQLADDGEGAAPGELEHDFGVDVENKVLTIGALDDLSGPAAAIGVPFSLGKRLAVEQVNAGQLDLLPDGWTVELVERDMAYNPQQSVAEFNAIKDDVLYFATSFGTPPTVPLIESATSEGITMFPAALPRLLAFEEFFPPVGVPYAVESHRAVEHAFEEVGEDLAFGLIYQLDDAGDDALAGAEEAAEFYGIDLVGVHGLAAGETDVTATVQQLQNAGATHVMLALVPSGTGPVLGTATQLGYEPVFYGWMPAWTDAFFDPEVLPPSVYANFRWINGVPLWGDDGPGMEAFLDGYEEFGTDVFRPDFYTIFSYTHAVLGFEAFARAYENGDVTRSGYHEALRSIDDFDAFGLYPTPIDMTSFPYVTVTETRIVTPGETNEEWQVLSDFATPESWSGLE